MIKNPPKEFDQRIEQGDNFFMLSGDYLTQLEKLPRDILQNIVIKLTKENKMLKEELKSIKDSFDNYAGYGPRWNNR